MFVKSEVHWLIMVPADARLPNVLLYLAVLGEEGEEGPVHIECLCTLLFKDLGSGLSLMTGLGAGALKSRMNSSDY